MENNNRTNQNDTDEFNAFHNNSSGGDTNRRTKRTGSKKKKAFQWNKKIVLAIVISVLVLLLVVGIVVAALSRDRHIMKEDNAFLVYTDSNGYHLLANGEEIVWDFNGEITLEVAADNSFAYVIEDFEGQYYIYLLQDKKLEPLIESGVDEVVAYAALEPGFVFKTGSTYRLYSEKYGLERITSSNSSADNFMISADASTVVYTDASSKKTDSEETSTVLRELIVFKDGVNTKMNTRTNCVPAAISNYGDYIYAAFVTENGQKLAVFPTKDMDNPQGEIIAETDGFLSVLSMNVKGDEVLLLTSVAVTGEDEETQEVISKMKTQTKLYRYSKKGEHTAVALAPAVMLPKMADPDIVYLDDFSDVYLTAYPLENPAQRAIYHMDKDYEVSRITKYLLPDATSEDSCSLSPDGEYLYYVNADKDLIQMNLASDTYETREIGFSVNKFFVTQKGNVYYLDDEMSLFFREATARRNALVSDYVTDISFYRYSNTLFFTKEEGESIFSTKEGSDEDIVKMGDSKITALPEFYNTNCKQSYAAYYDIDNGGILFYTSNGKRFKKITNDCLTINGVELTENLD